MVLVDSDDWYLILQSLLSALVNKVNNHKQWVNESVFRISIYFKQPMWEKRRGRGGLFLWPTQQNSLGTLLLFPFNLYSICS